MDLGSQESELPSRRHRPGWGSRGARRWLPKGVQVAICGRDRARIDDAAADIGAGACRWWPT
jgi:hypothetical protein